MIMMMPDDSDNDNGYDSADENDDVGDYDANEMMQWWWR